MKVVTDIYFDDLMDKVDSAGYEFLDIIDNLNLKDALMSYFDNEYADYPELKDILYDINNNSSELMSKLGIVDISDISDNFKDIYKQAEIAQSRTIDELSELLDDFLYLLDDSEMNYLKYNTKENLKDFTDDCEGLIQRISGLNDRTDVNYALINSICEETEKQVMMILDLLR